jgi:hypothetical protein
MTRGQVEYKLASGEWERMLSGIYRDVVVPITREQAWMAGRLWLGDRAALSHRSAAVAWGFDRVAEDKPEFIMWGRMWMYWSRPWSRRGARGRSLCHTSRHVPNGSAARVKPDRRPSGRCSIACGRSRLTGSDFEVLFFQLLRRAGLPLPEKQLSIHRDGRFIRRVDFAYGWAVVAIETDGYEDHGNKTDWWGDKVHRYRAERARLEGAPLFVARSHRASRVGGVDGSGRAVSAAARLAREP